MIIYLQENIVFVFSLKQYFIPFYFFFELMSDIWSKQSSISGTDDQWISEVFSGVELMHVFRSKDEDCGIGPAKYERFDVFNWYEPCKSHFSVEEAKSLLGQQKGRLSFDAIRIDQYSLCDKIIIFELLEIFDADLIFADLCRMFPFLLWARPIFASLAQKAVSSEDVR